MTGRGWWISAEVPIADDLRRAVVPSQQSVAPALLCGIGADRQKAYDWMCLTQNDQHAVEVTMKYVLLGNLSPEWASKQSDRTAKAKAKLDKLGIKIESIHYTQGYYDFVDIVDAPNPEALLAFSVWYSTHGLGRVQSMPAFEAKTFEAAIKHAAG
jgi:uncharacterized protein with GYD domain